MLVYDQANPHVKGDCKESSCVLLFAEESQRPGVENLGGAGAELTFLKAESGIEGRIVVGKEQRMGEGFQGTNE
jgi:hypothetical protein